MLMSKQITLKGKSWFKTMVLNQSSVILSTKDILAMREEVIFYCDN